MTQRSPFPEELDVGRRVPVDLPPQSPPTFAVDAARVNIQKVLLDGARINEEFNFGASNFIWVIESTSLGATADLRFNSQRNDAVPFKRGQVIRGLGFNIVYITNAAQPGESLTFMVVREGPGLVTIENPSANVAEVTFSKATVLDTLADQVLITGFNTSILPANANRREAIIQNATGAPNDIRIGDSNIGAARGIIIADRQTVILNVTEEIFARSINLIGNVAVMEILD